MQIMVILDLSAEEHDAHIHTADWVDYDSRDGELRVSEYDIHGELTGWRLYAKGHWLEARLWDGPTLAVLEARAARAERDRVAVRPTSGFPPGNSGPH